MNFPLRIIQLPDFNAKLKASTVTFGLDSYTIPITPRGSCHLRYSKAIFYGPYFFLDRHIGSGNWITVFTPSIIPSKR